MDDYIIYYGLTLIALLVTVGAQIFINASYGKYKKVPVKKGISGAEAARIILDKHGLSDIYVVETKGKLTDHYDPGRKVIRLSSDVYHLDSISSVLVAAHECGHAIQHKENYTFLKIRSMLVPFVNFSSYAGYIAIVLGCIFSMVDLIGIGIILECVILAFQLITLPVEFDASKRALENVQDLKILTPEELKGGKVVLTSAALTYVAGVVSALLEILRLVLIFTDRKD